MNLRITGLGQLELDSTASGSAAYETLYCGICRTDAKLLYEGQRDLVLPRVPGHEAVLRERATGRLVVPWPATSCGHCPFCLSGRQNLCPDVRIMGFHFDGAWAAGHQLAGQTLVEIGTAAQGARLDPALYCFCEPLACVYTAFAKLPEIAGQRLLVAGAGTLGLLVSLVAAEAGCRVLVLEKNQSRLEKAAKLCAGLPVSFRKSTDDSDFDLFFNACADYQAFALGLAKLARGGGLLFFSGLNKNQQLGTNLLNLIHYRELRVLGSYGLTPASLCPAIASIERQPDFIAGLVEGRLRPSEVAAVLPSVLAGDVYKYIIDCRTFAGEAPLGQAVNEGRPRSVADRPTVGRSDRRSALVPAPPCGLVTSLAAAIPPQSTELRARAQALIDNKTKPLGSLGRLEDLAVRICTIQDSLSPRSANRLMLVFAADHGLVEEGISAYPREVTEQMVRNFAQGGAAINVLCRAYGIGLKVIDIGVCAELQDLAAIHHAKVSFGTGNAALGPAMTADQANQAIEAGISAFRASHARQAVDLLGLGEMGIGNTSSAALLIAALTGHSVEAMAGRGTGVDDAQLAHKKKVLRKVFDYHRLDRREPFDILARVGGLEIAGMVGAALAAAAERVPVVLDGVISTAAGLVAAALVPQSSEYFIIGHRSVEPAQRHAAEALRLEPVFDLAMRLGEGSGAAVAMNLADTACRIFREMASFESAGVSGPAKGGG